jgi:hypothetical protein
MNAHASTMKELWRKYEGSTGNSRYRGQYSPKITSLQQAVGEWAGDCGLF